MAVEMMDERPLYAPIYENMFEALDCLPDAELREALQVLRAYVFDGARFNRGECSDLVYMLLVQSYRSLDAALERGRKNREKQQRYREKKAREAQEAKESHEAECSGNGVVTGGNEVVTDGDGEVTGSDSAVTEPECTMLNVQCTNVLCTTSKDLSLSPDDASKEPSLSEAEQVSDCSKQQSEQPQKKRESKPFVKPTISEIDEYGREYLKKKGWSDPFDPEAVYDFYESKNWMVGKTKMSKWKSAVNGWIRRDHEEKYSGGDQYEFENIRRYFDENVQDCMAEEFVGNYQEADC